MGSDKNASIARSTSEIRNPSRISSESAFRIQQLRSTSQTKAGLGPLRFYRHLTTATFVSLAITRCLAMLAASAIRFLTRRFTAGIFQMHLDEHALDLHALDAGVVQSQAIEQKMVFRGSSYDAGVNAAENWRRYAICVYFSVRAGCHGN